MIDDKFQEGYEGLRKSYALKLKDKLQELYQISHSLSGSCGIFGFPKISESASKLEENLKLTRTLLDDLIKEMETEL